MKPEPFAHDHPVVNTPAVWHPTAPRSDYSVVLFRRRFTAVQPIIAPTLWVTASQRFILYLDGRLVARGPSRSDPARWNCSRIDLPDIAPGTHVLAACVAHFGKTAAKAQLGGPAFFLLCADAATPALADIRTSSDWRSFHDKSREAITHHSLGRRSQIGPGDRFSARRHPWNWQNADFNDVRWSPAKVVVSAAFDPWGNRPLQHELRPDPLPPMDESAERFARVAHCDRALRAAAGRWIAGRGAVRIPARSTVRILLDRGELTNAYPVLTVSGGAGASVGCVYAEAPWDTSEPGRFRKTHRNRPQHHAILGWCDEFRPDGAPRRTFTTLWFRPFRYVELNIVTRAAPLTLDDVHLLFSAYPLRLAARFNADDPGREWDRMLAITRRTVRLCAHETFFDCPHYEQGQFPGDTRIQALYHYLHANDDRLARKAIDDFHGSRTPVGLISSHHPLHTVHDIPTYALYWIGMLHDFLVYRGDTDFLAPFVPFAREVIEWFRRRIRPDGMLGHIGYAPFMDWCPAFSRGNAPQDPDGGSALLTLLFAQTCAWMAQLESFAGFKVLSNHYRDQSRRASAAVVARCWNPRLRLLADTPARAGYSVHAQVEAALAGAMPRRTLERSLLTAMGNADVAQPGTLYYRFYVAQALKSLDRADRVEGLLDKWRALMTTSGLSTWPESDSPHSRSDCHAWSIMPGIEAIETILGVRPDPSSPGFAAVRFAPRLGRIKEATGLVPTPHGDITVQLARLRDGRTRALIVSPSPVYIASRSAPLRPGRHRLVFPAAN